jgi:hypothetical protein
MLRADESGATVVANVCLWFQRAFRPLTDEVNAVNSRTASKTMELPAPPVQNSDDSPIDFLSEDEEEDGDDVCTPLRHTEPVTVWGKRWLQQALTRLRLDLSASQRIRGVSEAKAEKSRVKQELKRYDTEFKKQFSRVPCRVDKEPVRPLYLHYKRLKAFVAQPTNGANRISINLDGPKPAQETKGTRVAATQIDMHARPNSVDYAIVEAKLLKLLTIRENILKGNLYMNDWADFQFHIAMLEEEVRNIEKVMKEMQIQMPRIQYVR